MSTQAPITRTGMINGFKRIYVTTPTKRTKTVSRAMLILVYGCWGSFFFKVGNQRIMRWRASGRHKGKASNGKSLWMLRKFIEIINIIVEIYQSLSRRGQGSPIPLLGDQAEL